MTTTTPLRIANCSGFYGDRLSAAREMVDGGPIDVLTGDWLAELTMLILAKDRQRRPEGGYAKTFVAQMADVLGDCAARGIKVVSNAGGLNPAGCAEEIRRLAEAQGLELTVAHVEGDDLMPWPGGAVSANAYLGAWGIVEALRRGADVVVTGRVTDASVVVGPAAWHHGWNRTDWDQLAAAVVAGHLIECGAQVTGGNYAFFREVPGLEHPGFPVGEIASDGTVTITKHPGTGGMVSVGTVTAQLLYEIQGLDYVNPDVVVRLDTVHLDDAGPDRVRVSGVRGLPAPAQTKVSVNVLGGYRNSMTFVLTGLDVEAKAELVTRTLLKDLHVETIDVQLRHCDDDLAELRVNVMDPDKDKVGRPFSSRVIEMTLASYPGMFTTTPPGDATAYGVFTPAFVPAGRPLHTAMVGDERIPIPPAPTGPAPVFEPPSPPSTGHQWDHEPTVPDPLGTIIGARSGDKGGNANVGLWAPTDEAYDWLQWYLSIEQLRALLPETEELVVERYELPNIRALNFVIEGLLGRGVAASTRTDPQAKGLGEYLRAQVVPLPIALRSP